MRLYLPHVMNVNGWMSECTCLASRPKIYIRVRNRNQLQSEAAAKSTLLVGLRQSRAEQSWAADVCADIRLSFPGVGGTQRQEGALAGSLWPAEPLFFPHIHTGLTLCLSHASENPGSPALSGPRLVGGPNMSHHTKEAVKAVQLKQGLLFTVPQKKVVLPPSLRASAVCLLEMSLPICASSNVCLSFFSLLFSCFHLP